MAAMPRRTGACRWCQRALATLAGLVLVAVVAVVAAPTTATLAASPSAGPSSAPGGVSSVEAWVDEALTPDAPAGVVLRVAITFWDTAQGTFADVSGIYVRLRPAEGKALPTEVTSIDSDWPGHVFASVAVPEGGPGKVEVGLRVDGGDVPIRVAGVGPPPDAPISSLVGAILEPVTGDVVAGRPLPVAINIVPLGEWSTDSLALPDELTVNAVSEAGAVVATAELSPAGPPGIYTGHVTIPVTGRVDLQPALPGDPGSVRYIGGSSGSLTVVEPGRRADATPGAPAPATPGSAAPGSVSTGDGGPPILVLAGIALVLLVAGGLVYRWLGDL